MKKIIIVNNNMKIGGVQKSLYNLLWSIEGKYEITLVLFQAVGAYVDQLPPGVKVIECSSLFRYLGISQGECGTNFSDWMKRGGLAAICRLFGRESAMKLILMSQRVLPETYDCAISFLHNGRRNGFYGGVQEFVLNRIRAKRKVAFLHCDYSRSGSNYLQNNRMLAQFDAIAACSKGCKDIFDEILPELKDKCTVVRNCHRVNEIRMLAEQRTVEYDSRFINVIMVSRLTHEKGIERGLSAAAKAINCGCPLRMHIVGGGPMEQELRNLAAALGIQDWVWFHGEQTNPYRFMKNADLFLMTSYHEAAPMVIEEARCLGLPVLTVETTSSHEMVTAEHCGWVCENSQEALEKLLLRILSDRNLLDERRRILSGHILQNGVAIAQFKGLVEGLHEAI